jgi:short-subunit dehydrogenase involved in D-alanine esterification of teichoic acids
LRQRTAAFAEQVENTIRINFIGTLNVCKLLFPLLNLHARVEARVVHVTPMAGGIHLIPNESLQNKFRKPDFESELVALAQQFVDLSKT